MCDEAVRQTRSQKRAQERDALPVDSDAKKIKLEGDGEKDGRPALRPRPDPSVRGSGILSGGGGEVKATIKVELQTKDEPVDMSTSKRYETRH